MSKRVYEIAREQSLGTKEVIERLRVAGVEVKNHFAVIEDPVYQRVFGNGQDGQPDTPAEAAVPAAGDGVQNGQAEASAQATPAPAETISGGEPATEARRGKSGRKRRRVVIDASATNRGPRPVATETAQKEPVQAPVEAKQEEVTVARVEPGATVKDLADALGVAPTAIIKVLMTLGEMKTLTQTLSTEEIELIAEEMGVEVEVGAIEEAVEAELPEDAPE